MPKRISIRADLKVEQLEQRYRQAQDPVARSQWQIVWLLAQGQPSEQVVEMTGYSLTWIRTIARRYNAEGEKGIGGVAIRGGRGCSATSRRWSWTGRWRERRPMAGGGPW